MTPPDRLRPGERLFALLLLLFAGYAFAESHAISGFEGLTTGGVMPMLASGVMVVTGALVLARTLPRPAAEGGMRGLAAYLFPLRVVLFLLLLAGYAVLIPRAGFLAASAALLFVAIWALWRRGPVWAAGLALVSVAVIHLLFRIVFQVVLPGGSWWQ